MENEDQVVDVLNMSDEEVLNFDPSNIQEQDVQEETNEELTNAEDQDPADEQQDDTKVEEEEADTEEAAEEEEEAEEAAESEEDAVDYKSVYEKITAPFKANGRDVQVKSVDDAIALMQMGANYNKKMAALKPNLRLMKMLETNGLLDESKLSFLIDLDKKNPEAISKLVKDSGVDPLELDTTKAGDYRPSSYKVDDREIELDQVLDSIQDTPTYSRTLDIVSNKWDSSSKQVIASSPQLLKVINQHVQSGIYDLISKEIESERMFGRLDGLSDIEAYRQIGDAIQARGGFNHLGNPVATAPRQQRVVTPAPRTANDDKLREKKRAASSTKPATPNARGTAEFDPLSMSDEEFSKVANPKFF